MGDGSMRTGSVVGLRARIEERSSDIELKTSTQEPATSVFGAARHISCTKPLISPRLASQAAEEVPSRVAMVYALIKMLIEERIQREGINGCRTSAETDDSRKATSLGSQLC